MLPLDDCSRRWTREIGELRSRASRASHHGITAPQGPELADVLEEALAMCTNLLQELAGSRLECQRLGRSLNASGADWDHLLDQLPIACVLTDAAGSISSANRAAALMLNLSVKHLNGRALLHFTKDREGFPAPLDELSAAGRQLSTTLTIRPRERAPLEVDVIVRPGTPDNTSTWFWFLSPVARAKSDA
jgi:PAS domain-containing protein